MTIDALAARVLVDAAHLAWGNRDMAALVACYCDDIRYTCNIGPTGTQPFIAVGKKAMLDFLLPVLDVTESMSIVETFAFRNEEARATIACFVKHKATGHVLSGQYRQVVRFRDGKIAQIDEFHDAARIAAFWKLVAVEATSRQDTAAEINPYGGHE